MSDSQRFYLIIPVYLLFSAPVGTLWEWKRSVMTPNPPHKAKDWASSLHMEASWGVGARTQGGCGLHVVPWGQIKAHNSTLGDLPPSLSSSTLSAQMPIKDLLAGQVQAWSRGAELPTEVGRVQRRLEEPIVCTDHTEHMKHQAALVKLKPALQIQNILSDVAPLGSSFLFFPLKWPTVSRPLPQQGP